MDFLPAFNLTQPRRKDNDPWLWIVILVSAAILSVLFIEPFSFDNAIYTSMASDLLRQGRIPYIGSFDQNFPGIILVHVLVITLFGPSVFGLRFFDFFVQIGFVIFFYKFLSRYLPVRTAALSAILYIFYYVGGGINIYAQRDVYISMCILVALALLLRNSSYASKFRIAASGIWLGLAILFRPTSLLFVACAGLCLCFDDEAVFEFRRISKALLLFLFALLPISGILLYYASIPGGLDAFYTCTIRYNLDIYSRMVTPLSFWVQFGRTGLLPIFAAIGLLVMRRCPSGKRGLSLTEFLFCVSLLLSSLCILLLMQKYFHYHFAPVMIGCIPLAAVGIRQSVSFISGRLLRRIVVGVLLVFCTAGGHWYLGPAAFISGVLSHTNPFEQVREVHNGDSQFGAVPEADVKAFLTRPKNQSGSIEVCSYAPFIRANLQRTFVGAFASFHELAPLTLSTMDSSYPFTDFQVRWRHKYMESLENLHPRFLVIARAMTFWDRPELYKGVLHTMPGFDSFMNVNYNFDTTIGGYEVYEWKNPHEIRTHT